MKQMLVIRKDLGMRKGKMIAQAAHASMGAVLPFLQQESGGSVEWMFEWASGRRKVEEWLAGPFKKIAVSVDSLEELLAVEEAAKAAGCITCLITDRGLTEFGGVPTVTCLAVGPDTDEVLDPITGDLSLL